MRYDYLRSGKKRAGAAGMTIEISSEDPRPIRAIEIAAGASNSRSDNHAPSEALGVKTADLMHQPPAE